MNKNLTYTVKEEDAGLKLRFYLHNTLQLSSRFIRGAGKNGKIKVNGKEARLNYVLQPKDEIEIELTKKESQNIEPENIPIEVIYEDSDLLVVNKKPGMVVHPTRSYPSGTLANGVLYYFEQKKESCIVRLVSRLDMDTSGLIMIGKNQFAHMALARDMVEEGFEKSYLAIVHGNFMEKKGTIDLPIGRPSEDSIQRQVCEEGQRSITHYEVIESFATGEMVKATLETGRTHQIRVHFTHMGHPIFGDSLYGKEEKEWISRQALHAYRLVIPHPRTRERLELEAPLPEDMKSLIEKLKNY